MNVTIRVAGEAGQGVATTGSLLVDVFAQLGLHVAATQSYMSRIRGGLNWYDIRIGDQPMYAGSDAADLLVALTDAARDILAGAVREGGLVLYNGQASDGAIAIDLGEVAQQVGGSKLYSNTVAAGAVMGLLGYDVGAMESLLAQTFKKKGPEVIDGNKACARKGAELAQDHAGIIQAPKPSEDGGKLKVCNGAAAIGLSAAVGGVKFAASYPMTPGTATFTFLAGAADKYGIVVEQAEDEIAAVNMLCGAVYAGVPAMATTSGGGFALMAEGMSLAGMMELPICVMIAQRPGPATGLPTRTGQQDLLFALHAGHGEFPRAIFAPGTVQQCYDVTRRALETAHEFQTPVVILTDQFLQDFEQTIEPLSEDYSPIDRCLAENPGSDYVRYAVTESGISPRALPGGAALVLADSDAHTAEGHLSEDIESHLVQQDKRMRKLDAMTDEAMAPELYGPPEAETLLICWGSTYGPAREAADILNAQGSSTAMLHYGQVWPICVEEVAKAFERRHRIIFVEGNQTGQFLQLLRMTGVVGEFELLAKYDGMPFTGTWIAERIAQ